MLIRIKKHKRTIAQIILPMLLMAGVGVLSPAVTEAGILGDLFGGVIGNITGGVQKEKATQIDKILHQAVKNNDIELARTALEKGANVNSHYEGHLPFDYAIYGEHFEMCDFLLV